MQIFYIPATNDRDRFNYYNKISKNTLNYNIELLLDDLIVLY